MLDRERVQAIHALTPLRNDAASTKAWYERLKREVEQLEIESVGAAVPERGDGSNRRRDRNRDRIGAARQVYIEIRLARLRAELAEARRDYTKASADLARGERRLNRVVQDQSDTRRQIDSLGGFDRF